MVAWWWLLVSGIGGLVFAWTVLALLSAAQRAEECHDCLGNKEDSKKVFDQVRGGAAKI